MFDDDGYGVKVTPLSIDASHAYSITPEPVASTTLKIEDASSPKQMVELVVFINPGDTTFSVISNVLEAEQPKGVVAITTTLAPFGINIGGDKLCGSKIFVELF